MNFQILAVAMKPLEMLHLGRRGAWNYSKPRPEIEMSPELRARSMTNPEMHYLFLTGAWALRADTSPKSVGRNYVRKTAFYHASRDNKQNPSRS